MRYIYCVIVSTDVTANSNYYDADVYELKDTLFVDIAPPDAEFVFSAKTPVFAQFEVLIINSANGTEVCGNKRKPQNFNIIYEYYSSIEDAIIRAMHLESMFGKAEGIPKIEKFMVKPIYTNASYYDKDRKLEDYVNEEVTDEDIENEYGNFYDDDDDEEEEED